MAESPESWPCLKIGGHDSTVENYIKRLFKKLGCQMVYFQTKYTNLGKFWWTVDGHLEYFTAIWDISRSFCIFCVHLVHFIPILEYQEKSSNPAGNHHFVYTMLAVYFYWH
jgi:hypothetical protein